MKKLILRCGLSLGDIVMLTAAVRDLHRCHPQRFQTDVRTFFPELWEHNPYLTALEEEDPGVEQIDCSYPLINRCNEGTEHCLHGFIQFLNGKLGLAIQLTASHGDVHLSAQEKSWYSQVYELCGANLPFWIIAAGGKYDVTIKWWDPRRFQAVVDHFRGRVQFVQVGREGHHHPRLEGVIDLRGRTDLRQLIRLVYHADGVLCPITGLMHLAAATEGKPGAPPVRPCVVIAGGREPAHWEAYPGHQFIHVNGALPCCPKGGCWRDRTFKLRDGDVRDRPSHLCQDVVEGLPRCMSMISSEEVNRRIEWYYTGGVLKPLGRHQLRAANQAIAAAVHNPFDRQPLNLQSAGMACDQFLASIPAFPGGYEGRGIVICAGGVRYFTNAWVCVKMLRRLGCRLPIELWFLSGGELDESMRALIAPLGVKCVDASRLGRRPRRLRHGWQLKADALVHCSFREVMLLDADNVPVVNPEFLFETQQFKQTGAIFWPDYVVKPNSRAAAIWRSCGLSSPKEPEFESGQIVVDKQRCWQALCLSLWFNEHADFYYQYVHGDKETFHLAFKKAGKDYSLVPTLSTL